MLPVFTLRWGQQPDWKRYPNWCLLNCCVLTLVPTVAPDMIPLNTDKWLSDQEDPEAERGGLVDQSVKMLKNFIGKVKPSCASLIIKTVISLYDHRLNSEIILMIKVLNRFSHISLFRLKSSLTFFGPVARKWSLQHFCFCNDWQKLTGVCFKR